MTVPSLSKQNKTSISILDQAEKQDLSGGKAKTPNLRTATSDAVAYSGGTIFKHGTFPMTVIPFSAFISKALLYPPSFLSILIIGEPTLGSDETTLHSASMSKRAYRFASSYSSLTRKRPLLYLNTPSGEQAFPEKVNNDRHDVQHRPQRTLTIDGQRPLQSGLGDRPSRRDASTGDHGAD